jgi:hypothetical protein
MPNEAVQPTAYNAGWTCRLRICCDKAPTLLGRLVVIHGGHSGQVYLFSLASSEIAPPAF